MIYRYYHAFITLPLTLALVIALASPAFAGPRIASLDWTLAETLIALDAPPIALAQTDDYASWVGQSTPMSVTDIGLRTQPNLELLANLAPDRILISPMFANLAPRLSTIAPVETLSIYTPDKPVWPELEALTRKLGELSDHEKAAERLVASSRAEIDCLASRQPAAPRPLMIVQFMDARHVRVFGANSLFDAVINQLGLTNIWKEPTNAWGFSLAGLERLISLEQARLVIIEPYPAGVAEALKTSGLWQSIPSVTRDDVITLPPTWSFGGLPSAMRFAKTLTAALSDAQSQTLGACANGKPPE
ncbi:MULTISPECIES: ABC transporter substrate-binding protein [Halomonadaceae]|uniref:ABC transporter substrate-binding protein n=1 Tax=Halomonas cibimaris TaxID=657012 RepID=A0ABP7L685_9GAMM|nr:MULTISPECIES: ABC transporter substrate-binding protein [Halomonas]